MERPVTLFTGQWTDLEFESICRRANSFGYDGVEIACWGDHFDVRRAIGEVGYCASRWEILKKNGLTCFAMSNHLVGQAVCDRIDKRHKSILPPHVWGDGSEEGVRGRAAEEMKNTARAAAKMGLKVVNGFVGSSIWHLIYSFPPVHPVAIDEGFQDFARRWIPILDVFGEVGVRFGLEVHPTEIAFDICTASRALEAIGGHEFFGFNFDPSHLAYQGVDYLEFIRTFADRIFHVHIKDVSWSERSQRAGVFGGYLPFGHQDRFWDFRTPGRGKVQFEEIIRGLNQIGYQGPLSVEWEDPGMDRDQGAEEAATFVRRLDFKPAARAFDAAFQRE